VKLSDISIYVRICSTYSYRTKVVIVPSKHVNKESHRLNLMVRNAFVRSENIYKHAGRILPQGHSAKTWISKIEKKKVKGQKVQ